MPGSLDRYACALALASSLLGCVPEPEAELLEVRSIQPERVEPGHVLEIAGAGFPPGRAARVRLEGTMLRPGEHPREVRVELEGRAISSEQVDARFTTRALDALGGRGTLHGFVVVSFEAIGEGAVVGRSRALVLDVTPPSTAELGDELSRARRAALFAGELGLGLGEEPPDRAGLPVESVEEASAAARAGIVPGDRLVALDGVRLHALSDLLPAPSSSLATLELAREGEASTLEVRVPLTTESGAMSSRELRAAQAALVLALVIALLLAPSAVLLEWASRPSRRPRSARAVLLRTLLAAMILGAVVALDAIDALRVPLELAMAAFLAVRTSSAYLGGRDRRVRAVAGALGKALLAAIALGSAAALGGTSDLAALEELSGAAPWEWTALATPAGPLLVVLLVIAGSWRGEGRGSALDEAAALVLAAIAAAVLLGGWSAPFAGTGGQALGALLYVVSGLACWSAMRKLGEASPRRVGWCGAACGVLAAGATVAWIALEPPIERALEPEALTVVLAIVLVALVVRRIALPEPREAGPALPFL